MSRPKRQKLVEDTNPAPLTPNQPLGWYLKGLTMMERAFVIEYPIDFNATRAALRAGYGKGVNAGVAANQGSLLLQDPRIVGAIMAQLQAMAERANIRQDRVLKEVAAIAFSKITNYEIDDYGNVALAEGAPAAALSAISRIKKKIRHEIGQDGEPITTYETELYLWNKNDALNSAMRHLGMFLDRKVTVVGTLEEMMKLLNEQRHEALPEGGVGEDLSLLEEDELSIEDAEVLDVK